MKFSTLLLVNAVIFLAYGIGFILIPSTIVSLYDVSPVAGTIISVQHYGGLLLAVGLLCWLFRRVTDFRALRAMQLSFLIAFAINSVTVIIATLNGTFNALGWTAVLIYLLLTAGYAYFYFTMPREPAG